MPFRGIQPGLLSRADARQLNDLLFRLEGLLQLNLSPPLMGSIDQGGITIAIDEDSEWKGEFVRLVDTTIAASIAAGSGVIVTPADMTGIVVGAALTITKSTTTETVTVSAVTGSTFSATFLNSYTGPGITATSALNGSGYYSGAWCQWVPEGPDFQDEINCWIADANAVALTPGLYYRARWGDFCPLATTLDCYVTNAGGSGSGPTVEQTSGGTPVTGSNVIEFNSTYFTVTGSGGTATITLNSGSIPIVAGTTPVTGGSAGSTLQIGTNGTVTAVPDFTLTPLGTAATSSSGASTSTPLTLSVTVAGGSTLLATLLYAPVSSSSTWGINSVTFNGDYMNDVVSETVTGTGEYDLVTYSLYVPTTTTMNITATPSSSSANTLIALVATAVISTAGGAVQVDLTTSGQGNVGSPNMSIGPTTPQAVLTYYGLRKATAFTGGQTGSWAAPFAAGQSAAMNGGGYYFELLEGTVSTPGSVSALTPTITGSTEDEWAGVCLTLEDATGPAIGQPVQGATDTGLLGTDGSGNLDNVSGSGFVYLTSGVVSVTGTHMTWDGSTTVTVNDYLSTPWGSGTSFNMRLGAGSGNSSGTGDYNTAIGYTALAANTTGNFNTAIGNSALHANTTGYQNVAIGSGALPANTTGYYNVSFGSYSMSSNQTGGANVAIGSGALTSSISGNGNVAIGNSALYNYTGSGNLAIGYTSLYNATTGSGNVGVGYGTLPAIVNGSENVAIGDNAGQTAAYAPGNICIGGYTSTAGQYTQYGIALGYVATCGSNEFALSPYVTQQTFHGRSSTFTDRKVGSFTWGFDVNTDASYQGYLNILGWDYNGAPYTVISVGGNGSAGTLGFFKATKVIQQNTTGTGTTGYTANVSANGVYAQSTFTGGVGSTAYGISDIVLALKNYGLLAN